MVSKGHNKKFTFCIQKYKIKVFVNQLKLSNDSFGFIVWNLAHSFPNVGHHRCLEVNTYLPLWFANASELSTLFGRIVKVI